MFRKKRQISEEDADRILAVTADVMKREGLSRDPDLDAALTEDGLGFDSMGVLDLLQALETEFDVSIPEEYWGTKKFKNLRELAIVVAGK